MHLQPMNVQALTYWAQDHLEPTINPLALLMRILYATKLA